MKKFIVLCVILLSNLGISKAQAQLQDVKITAPKAEENIRVGKTYVITWDTLDSKKTSTKGSTFEFFWAESATPAGWNKLGVGKASGGVVSNSFKDESKGAAVGKVVTVFPSKQNLYIKMQLQGSNTVSSITGPIHIITPPPANADSLIKGDITGKLTLYPEKIYKLNGVVFVQSGGELNIKPGTVILGDDKGTSALVVNRGGKIFAKGTAKDPIVFTSPYAAGSRDRGDWGGVILLGNASTNLGEAAIEGGIADAATVKKNGWYGALNGVTNDDDSSGELEYVRIEFAGIAESPDNELNGLTLGGVGRKTVIKNVQVSYSGDDSFEWFGGTVNCKNLIAFNGIDDDFDTDNGYRGNVQFGFSYRMPKIADQSNSEAFESDNDAAASENKPFTSPVFSNMTCVGGVRNTDFTPGSGDNNYNSKYLTAAQIRRNSRLSLFNSLLIGWPAGLELTNDNTVRAAGNDSVQVQFNNFIGIKSDKYFYFGGTTKATDKVTADWLKTTAYGNEFNTKAGMIDTYAQLTNLFPNDLTQLNPTPAQEASFKNNAAFTPEKLKDGFFEKVSYRGAFAPTNVTPRWDAEWANYDPVNTVYKPKSDVNDVENTVYSVRITPNPVKNISNVNIDFPQSGNISIKLYNEMGILIAVIADGSNLNNTNFELDASNLSNGTYFLRVSNGTNIMTKNIKVIK